MTHASKHNARHDFRFLLAAILLIPVFCALLISWKAVAQTLLFEFAAFALVRWAIYQRARGFTRRIHDKSPQLLSVHVNGIQVGTLSDGQYAGIQRDILFDIDIAKLQIYVTLRFIIAFTLTLACIVPVVAFWLLATLAMIAPGEFTYLLTAVSQHDTAVISQLLACVLEGSTVVAMLTIFAFTTRGGRKVSCYRAEEGRRLRQRFASAADGEVWVRKRIVSAQGTVEQPPPR